MALTPRLSSFAQTLRLWWLEHGGTAGVGVGASAILTFGVLLIPHGPVTQHTGRITGFRAMSSDMGTEVYASVDVEGRPTLVQLTASNDCSVGGTIALQKVWFPMGARYAVREPACARADR